MPVRGSLASLAMATTGCAPGHLKDANGVCRLVYVPEVLSPPTQMPPDDQRYEDQYQWGPGMEQMPPPPAAAPPPIDPGEFFPITDPGWSTPSEMRTPYSALGTIQYPRDAVGLVDYVQDWERPGWTAGDFEDAGLFKIGAQLATTDPGGYFGDNKYPGVPIIRNNWAERQRLLQEQIAIMSPKGTEGRPQFPGPFEGDEARTARLKEVQDLRSDLMEQQQEWRLEDYNRLFKIGTPYEIEWRGGSQTGDNWKVAPEAGEHFGGWGIYSGGTSGSFTPKGMEEYYNSLGKGATAPLFDIPEALRTVGVPWKAESSDGITTPLPSIPSPSPMPMPMPIPDNSLPTPIEEYNSSPHGAGSTDQFESYLQHFPPGTYTHEGALQDFLGRPPNAQELYMLDLNNNQFNMPVIDPGDNQYNMPNVDPYNWELPPNNDGLLGIVGGGLVDQPIWDA
mgnify:CR=1 FL=1